MQPPSEARSAIEVLMLKAELRIRESTAPPALVSSAHRTATVTERQTFWYTRPYRNSRSGVREMAEAFVCLFEKAQLGDRLARDAVYKFAFCRLKVIASALLRREHPGHTLQPTALVSELYLKLQRLETRILSEDHFFRISARAMRQVLIDYSRVRSPAMTAPLDLIPELLQLAHRQSAGPETVLAVKMVFEKLRAMDMAVAETVWLRCVEGRTVHEMSLRQKREEWRVRADYDFGLQWMANRLKRHA